MKWIAAMSLCVLSACSSGEKLPVLGGDAYVDDWRGRGVIINYWAEWCAPCREEIPEFNAMHAQGAIDGPIVVGVNYDGLNAEELAAAAERMGIEFPTLLFDPRERFGYERPQMMPTTMVLDGDLQVKAKLVGPQTHATLMKALTGTGKP